MDRTPSDKLTPNDLQLLQAAQAELQAAINVSNFVQAHIAKAYKLNQGDNVAQDGTIIRVPVAG